MEDLVVADTDVLIDYFADRAPFGDAVECGTQNRDALTDFEHLIRAARILPLDAVAALRAGALYRDLRASGEALDTADLLIAGCCLAANLSLLTRNLGHFRRVRGLRLQTAQEILDSDAG